MSLCDAALEAHTFGALFVPSFAVLLSKKIENPLLKSVKSFWRCLSSSRR